MNWVHGSRAVAVAMPLIVLAIMPWPAQTGPVPSTVAAIEGKPVLLAGHVFKHGCSTVSARLNGQEIRVSPEGNFAVYLKAPRQPLTAFLEFVAPDCKGSIQEVRIEPGVARYSVTTSLLPEVAVALRRRATGDTSVAKAQHPGLPRSVWALSDLIEQYATATGLDAALVYAVVHTESNFDTHARSRSNAVGLMQLIPDQGARAAADFLADSERAISVAELRNPATNLRLGTAYLQLLSDRYFNHVGNDEARMALALAAYNWGPGNIQNAIRLERRTPRTLTEVKQMLARRAPLETRRYVESVTKRMAWYEEVV